MKKIILITIILALFIIPLSASEEADTAAASGYKSGDTMVSNWLKLALTVKNSVFMGCTNRSVTSALVPSDTLSEIHFTFDPFNNKWVTTEAHLYVISFVTYPVKVTLTANRLYKSGSTTEYIPYTLNVKSTSMNSDCKSIVDLLSSDTSSFYTSSASGYYSTKDYSKCTKTLVSESSKSYKSPRVMNWDFEMEVDGSSITSSSASKYVAEFVMTITKV